MEDQANQNEEIVNQLQRKTRVQTMKSQMDKDIHASSASFKIRK